MFYCRNVIFEVKLSTVKAFLILTSGLFFLSVAAACQNADPGPVPELIQHAEGGDAQAQFELGRAYEDGKGVPQDDDRAVEWYRKSAKQGLLEAIYNIAISYYNGEGVEANLNDAATWMMVASRRGDAQATEALKQINQELHQRREISKFQLAQLYDKGDELPPDLPAAASLYRELAEEKDGLWYNDGSRYQLCQMYSAGNGVQQDYPQAKSWCKKSQTAFSYVVLGRMAEQGLGQSKNLREALDYYKQAAFRAVPDGYMN